jgi:ribosomal protein L10
VTITIGEKQKSFMLNEKDDLWNRYKTIHIADLLNLVSHEFKEFTKENKEAV